jgi:hypothetical protein
VAEEEGFDFAQYEGGTRWHVLVCYSRNVESKGFTIFPDKRCFSAILIPLFFVARPGPALTKAKKASLGTDVREPCQFQV